jgi:pyruvate dehydrogenase complex dihydrolipoamide acetyltransferase long form
LIEEETFMKQAFKLPDVGEGIAEAEIVEYLVQKGDKVKADQPVVKIETDKAVVELPAPVTGVVVEIPFKPGDSVRVGETLLVIETEAAEAEEPAKAKEEEKKKEEKPSKEEEKPPKKEEPRAKEEERPSRAEGGAPAERVLATPHTRKVARELKVDITTVKGSGPHGRITDEDVRKAAEEKEKPAAAPERAPAPKAPTAAAVQAPATTGFDFEKYGPTRREPLKGIRKRTAEVMVRSVSTIPHVTHFDEADVTELMSVVEREKPLAVSRGIKLTVLSFLVKAAATGLKQYPKLNCSLDEETGEIVYKDYYHIGFATDTEAGLMVPVVRDVDRKSVLQVAAELQGLSTKARERSIELDDMRGGTFTVTNVGSLGGMWATPIIVHPQVAILCPLRAQPRPLVREGQVVIRTVMPLTLSFDHRVLDGADAARYTSFLISLLEDPMRMLVDMA